MGATETNSVEVRWFGDGEPPGPVTAWLTGLGPAETATRTDLYALPPTAGFNCKLRAGGEAVELKRRLWGPESCSLREGVTGGVEGWYKWGFPLADPADPTRAGLWLPVEKTRTLCPLADRLSDVPEVTAHAEVTTVRAAGGTAWTVCLEAAGPPDHLEPAFDAAAAVFETAPESLSAARSVGYAGWLRNLVAADPDPAVLVPSRR